jgi:alpha-beta hydrolase superfamily lysophospholipase
MPFFDGASGHVYYRHWSTPDPRAALVFLHGFGEHSGLYHRYAAELGAHGIDLWALDEIGHGLTEGERGHSDSFSDLVLNARTLTDLARAGSPDVPLVVGGHSLGSLVAIVSALENPSTYVGAVVSGTPLSPLDWLAAAAGSPDKSFDLEPEALSSDPFYLDQLENDPLAFTSGDVVALFATTFPAVWARLDSELADLAVPLLAVHGAADEVAPLSGVVAWQDRLTQLRLEVVPDAGHDVLNEVAHARVADVVASFVLEHSATARSALTSP